MQKTVLCTNVEKNRTTDDECKKTLELQYSYVTSYPQTPVRASPSWFRDSSTLLHSLLLHGYPFLFKASFRMGLPVVTASLEGTLSTRTTGNTDPCTLSRRIKRRKAFFRSCSLLPNLVSFFGSCSIPSSLSSLFSRLKSSLIN